MVGGDRREDQMLFSAVLRHQYALSEQTVGSLKSKHMGLPDFWRFFKLVLNPMILYSCATVQKQDILLLPLCYYY